MESLLYSLPMETNNREMSFEDVVSLTTQLISHGFLSLDLQV